MILESNSSNSPLLHDSFQQHWTCKFTNPRYNPFCIAAFHSAQKPLLHINNYSSTRQHHLRYLYTQADGDRALLYPMTSPLPHLHAHTNISYTILSQTTMTTAIYNPNTLQQLGQPATHATPCQHCHLLQLPTPFWSMTLNNLPMTAHYRCIITVIQNCNIPGECSPETAFPQASKSTLPAKTPACPQLKTLVMNLALQSSQDWGKKTQLGERKKNPPAGVFLF